MSISVKLHFPNVFLFPAKVCLQGYKIHRIKYEYFIILTSSFLSNIHIL
uniref:Uncharacterized protein n=1 Tax=Anguilla anguilla TaxID=7936 RepID=A0A0E9WH50_ANGAN